MDKNPLHSLLQQTRRRVWLGDLAQRGTRAVVVSATLLGLLALVHLTGRLVVPVWLSALALILPAVVALVTARRPALATSARYADRLLAADGLLITASEVQQTQLQGVAASLVNAQAQQHIPEWTHELNARTPLVLPRGVWIAAALSVACLFVLSIPGNEPAPVSVVTVAGVPETQTRAPETHASGPPEQQSEQGTRPVSATPDTAQSDMAEAGETSLTQGQTSAVAGGDRDGDLAHDDNAGRSAISVEVHSDPRFSPRELAGEALRASREPDQAGNGQVQPAAASDSAGVSVTPMRGVWMALDPARQRYLSRLQATQETEQ